MFNVLYNMLIPHALSVIGPHHCHDALLYRQYESHTLVYTLRFKSINDLFTLCTMMIQFQSRLKTRLANIHFKKKKNQEDSLLLYQMKGTQENDKIFICWGAPVQTIIKGQVVTSSHGL